MLLRHKYHIERITREMAILRRILRELEWQRRSFIELDDNKRPTPSGLTRLYRRVARALAFWLLK